MSTEISRRDFLKRSSGALAVGTIALTGADKVFAAAENTTEKGTIIDLSKCDGCHLKILHYASSPAEIKTRQFP